MTQDTYITTTDQGPITLTMPSELAPESYQDFEDWIHLVLRGAKRRVAKPVDRLCPICGFRI